MEDTIMSCEICEYYERPYLPGTTFPGQCLHPDAVEQLISPAMTDDHPPYCPLAETAGGFSGALGAIAAQYVESVKEDIRFTESPVEEPKSTMVVGRDIDIECAFLIDSKLLEYIRANLPEPFYTRFMSYTESLKFGDGFCGWVDTSLTFADMTSDPIIDMKFSGDTTADTLIYLPRGKEKSWFSASYLGPQDMIRENEEFFRQWISMPIGFDWARHIVDIHGTVKC